MRRFMALLTVSFVLVFGSACQSFMDDPWGDRDDFEEIQGKFTKFVRWGAIDEASIFVADDQRDEFLDLAPDLTDVRFTDYEVLDLDYKEEDTKASVVVRYTGYRLSVPVEKSFRVNQEWEKNAENGTWTVRLDVAKLRDALAVAMP